jgi:hypothetical protein
MLTCMYGYHMSTHKLQHRCKQPIRRVHPVPVDAASVLATIMSHHQVGGRQALPLTWSMVWLAPQSCSSPGRSAVSSSSGTPAWLASTTAGSRLATAVPLLVITTAGTLEQRGNPLAHFATTSLLQEYEGTLL